MATDKQAAVQGRGDLEAVVAAILDAAARQGASAAEAGVSAESGLAVTVRLGEVETVEHNRDKGLGVTVYFGQRKGSASTSDYSPQVFEETVRGDRRRRSRHAARLLVHGGARQQGARGRAQSRHARGRTRGAAARRAATLHAAGAGDLRRRGRGRPLLTIHPRDPW